MKKALIVGLGISGKAALEYLEREGWEVVAVDSKRDPPHVLPDTTEFVVFDFNLVVVSPGIAMSHPLYIRAQKEGVEIVGEMELALRHLNNSMIGVTGSNGKSTTVSLIAHVLNESGRKARAVGNIGTPLLSLVGNVDPEEILVLEISSFQLETLSSRKLTCAAILNINPNHLDRHKTMEEYIRLKQKIKTLVQEGGVYYENLGLDNAVYVRAITAYFGVDEKSFQEALITFAPLPHRLEYVGEIQGIPCYNDSKATTPEAVSYAVRTLEKGIILIAGGRNKGCSFSSWNETFCGKVKKILLLGESKELIKKQLQLDIPISLVDSLESAVEKGLQCAEIGDTLLLSPGCASYDMFLNFEKRGEMFKKIVSEKKNDEKRYDYHCCSD